MVSVAVTLRTAPKVLSTQFNFVFILNTVEGKFLALDLGGTNFRVLLIEIVDEQLHNESEIFSVPDELMKGTGEALFDYIVACIHSFMDKRNLIQYRFPLGFTFSFPCRQEGLNRARLTTWTKGFKCSGVEGEDVVDLLRQAIDRRNVSK